MVGCMNDEMTDRWLFSQFQAAMTLAHCHEQPEDVLPHFLRGFANRILMAHGQDPERCNAALSIPFTPPSNPRHPGA